MNRFRTKWLPFLKSRLRSMLQSSEKGMTLVEIMVVVAIIGGIAAIVAVNVMRSLDEARVENTKTQIHTLEGALMDYKRKCNSYPTTDQGLQALVAKPSSGKTCENYPKGGFLNSDRVPKDAWGNEFKYYSPGLSGHDYEILSLGGDGQEGGEGVDADLKSYEIK